jgi:hypothetical protein
MSETPTWTWLGLACSLVHSLVVSRVGLFLNAAWICQEPGVLPILTLLSFDVIDVIDV